MSNFLTIIQDKNIKNASMPPIYNTYSTLIPYLFIPMVCLLGVVTNFLNITVFFHPKMADISFKYMLIASLADLSKLNYKFLFLLLFI